MIRPATQHQLAIHACGLAKCFFVRGLLPGRPRGRVDALRGVDLSVPEGTIHGIIGPNGSGKSTLLRILVTLVLPTAGTATVSGADVLRQPAQVRRQVGFSTGEERSVYWRLTGRQNLEFYAAMYHVDEPRRRVDDLLGQLDLSAAADRPAAGYSQGMLRRLGLARALLHAPPVLILDEPTRSLDPLSRDRFHELINELRNDAGTTILMATHDLSEAADICDGVSILNAGTMVEQVHSTDAAALRRALRAAAE